MNFIIDPELKYCPSCEDEYRAEIEQCASCGMQLLTGSEILKSQDADKNSPKKKTLKISPNEELVDIRRGSMMEIRSIQTLLEDQGISTVTTSEDSCGKGCCGSELFLKIRVADIQDAVKFLGQEHARATGLENHDISHMDAVFNTAALETTCPACGCTFEPTTPTCPDCGLCFA